MKNKRGLTASEKIQYDIEIAKTVKDEEQRKLVAYMAIAAAELAVDFGLISFEEWGSITKAAFQVM